VTASTAGSVMHRCPMRRDAGTGTNHIGVPMPSASVIQRLRREAFQRQGRRCYYCQVVMWLHKPEDLPGRPPSLAAASSVKCTAEHLVPKSEGGRDFANNVAAACDHCNRTRHRRKTPPSPEALRKLIAARLSRGAWHNPWVFELGLFNLRQQPPRSLLDVNGQQASSP